MDKLELEHKISAYISLLNDIEAMSDKADVYKKDAIDYLRDKLQLKICLLEGKRLKLK